MLDERGQTDFDEACARLRSPAGPSITVFVFDILALVGEESASGHYRERKRLLGRVLRSSRGCLQPVHVVSEHPDCLVESVKELGLEGVVAEYSGAPYRGGRTSLWRKLVRCRPEKGWPVEQRACWR